MSTPAKAALAVVLGIAVLATLTSNYLVTLLAVLIAASIPVSSWLAEDDDADPTLPAGFPNDTGF